MCRDLFQLGGGAVVLWWAVFLILKHISNFAPYIIFSRNLHNCKIQILSDPGLQTTTPGNDDIMVPAVYPEKKLPPKGGGFHFFKKGGDTSQVGDDLKRGDPTPWDTRLGQPLLVDKNGKIFPICSQAERIYLTHTELFKSIIKACFEKHNFPRLQILKYFWFKITDGKYTKINFANVERVSWTNPPFPRKNGKIFPI